jgi:hypothetical protein
MPTATKTAAPSWTCVRCEVTIRYLPGHKPAGTPSGWTKKNGQHYCLNCRRELAAEEGFANAPDDMPMEKRVKLRTTAVVEFEILRDPERPNGEIAKVAHCSIPAVAKARQRLEQPKRS